MCLKLTEIHLILIALLPYQYKASTKKYKQCMIGKEDNKFLLNVVFNALSFLLAPLTLLLVRRPWYCTSTESLNNTTHNMKCLNSTPRSFSSTQSLNRVTHNTKRLKRIDSSAFASHSTPHYRNTTLVSTNCYHM